MSSFPAAAHITDAARTEAEVKTDLDDWLKATKQIPGCAIAETTLTLATDAVTPGAGVGGIFSIDTEAAAATDNLKNIVQTNLPDGNMLLIRCVSAARNVVVKSSAGGAGQITLRTAGDFTLGDPLHWLLLKRTGALWEEIARFPDALPAILTKTANYTTTAQDRAKLIDGTSGTWTLTLLPAATAGIGFLQPIKNSSSGATAATITLDGNAAETIDGSTTRTLSPGDEIVLVCDGSNWKSLSATRFTGLPIAAAAGTVDAITATFSPVLTLTDKMLCAVVGAGANTITTPTFAPDGLTARTITRNGGVALSVGDIGAAGFVMMLEYNLANTRWELMNPIRPNGTIQTGSTLTKNPFAVNTQTVTAHALGATPTWVTADIVCVNAAGALGYSQNARIQLIGQNTNITGAVGMTVEMDLTNVTLTISNNSNIFIANKSTNALTQITAADWKVELKPYLVKS